MARSPETSPKPASASALGAFLSEIGQFPRDLWKFIRFWLRFLRVLERIAVAQFRLLVWLIVSVTLVWLLFNPDQEWIPFVGFLGLGLMQLLYAMMFIFVQFGFMFWFLSRSRMFWIMPDGGEELGLNFADYRGNPELVEHMRRIVELAKGNAKFKEMGGELTRGILLLGPPGTGKSYMAQVVASESKAPFGYLSAPSLTSMFMGMGNMKVGRLYSKANKLAEKYGVCYVFIDEIDAIGMSRSGPAGMGGGGMMGGLFGMGGGSGLLNELLIQLDPPPVDQGWWQRFMRSLGLRKTKSYRRNVITIAATNAPEGALDAALLRPGRFDMKIRVEAPSSEGRRDIIGYYLNKVAHEPSIEVDWLVGDTIGYTPVAIKHIINQGLINALINGREKLTYEDITYAREIYEWGLAQPILNMAEDERRAIAYHEGGHGIAQALLLPHHRVSKVTIIRHGDALGLAAAKPTSERHTSSQEEIAARIMVSLASRAAEEKYLGTRLSGFSGDLANATQMAIAMLIMFGMGRWTISAAAFPGMGPSPEILAETERLLSELLGASRRFLDDHDDLLRTVAERLITSNEVSTRDMERILAEYAQSKDTSVAGIQQVCFEKYVKQELARIQEKMRSEAEHRKESDVAQALREGMGRLVPMVPAAQPVPAPVDGSPPRD